jgi:SAM-dependent methyltransferase
MLDPLLARLRDRLPVNPPYEGLVAEAYDAWITPDDEFEDDAVYVELLENVDGPVLELGCGTGRPLLRWLAAGHDVEGIDASADMLAILRRHAAERGLEPTLHHGDIAPLRLGRSFAALMCPAGTFTLVHEPEAVRVALDSYLRHLRPGGLLALTLFQPPHVGRDALTWRIRRSATTAGGTTLIVHEAVREDTEQRLQVIYNRLEAYGPDGRLLDTWMRRQHLRWWERDEIETLVEEVGFVDVRSIGDDHDWVTTAFRSAS